MWPPQPLTGDAVDRWVPMRLVGVLHAVGICTLADLTLRVPTRRRWGSDIAGLGPAGVRHDLDVPARQRRPTGQAGG